MNFTVLPFIYLCCGPFLKRKVGGHESLAIAVSQDHIHLPRPHSPRHVQDFRQHKLQRQAKLFICSGVKNTPSQVSVNTKALSPRLSVSGLHKASLGLAHLLNVPRSANCLGYVGKIIIKPPNTQAFEKNTFQTQGYFTVYK